MKAELMEKTPRVFSGNRRFTPSFDTMNDKSKSVVNKDSVIENRGPDSASGGSQQNKAPMQKPTNSYVKPSCDKCFRCGGQGHRSNVYVLVEEQLHLWKRRNTRREMKRMIMKE